METRDPFARTLAGRRPAGPAWWSRAALALLVALCGSLLLSATGAAAEEAPPIPDDQAILQILKHRIDEQKRSVGIVVGVVEPDGRRVVAWGRRSVDAPGEVDGDTVYEIGSITKVFTTILLADLVQEGVLELDMPVRRLLGADAVIPTRGGAEITLEHLATHSSGLPRMPSNFRPTDGGNPYADYTMEQFHEYLATCELRRDIGAAAEYSNLGMGLLGNALATLLRRDLANPSAARGAAVDDQDGAGASHDIGAGYGSGHPGRDYEELVFRRILEPLGIATRDCAECPVRSSTRIAWSNEQREGQAAPHSVQLRPVANWDLPTLAGAGAFRSSVNDMLTFVEANLGLRGSSAASPLAGGSRLRAAMDMTHEVRRDFMPPQFTIGLGWIIRHAHGRELHWHNGGTGGYRSFLGFDLETRTGVVVLSNSGDSVDDLGFHLLDTRNDLVVPPWLRDRQGR